MTICKLLTAATLLMAGHSQIIQAQDIQPAKEQQATFTGSVAGHIYENVCHLTIKRFPGGTSFGSAVLFEGRYLLTAGHNVFQDRSRVRSIDVRCGVKNANTELACDADPECNETVQGWQGRDARRFNFLRFPNRFDYGVIRLNQPIATAKPVTLASTAPKTDSTVLIAGYPGEAVDGTRVGDAKTLKDATVAIKPEQIYDDTVSYNILTASGNSGGPVWLLNQDGSYELLAIHIQPSLGRLVNDEFKGEIRQLMTKLDGRAAKSD